MTPKSVRRAGLVLLVALSLVGATFECLRPDQTPAAAAWPRTFPLWAGAMGLAVAAATTQPRIRWRLSLALRVLAFVVLFAGLHVPVVRDWYFSLIFGMLAAVCGVEIWVRRGESAVAGVPSEEEAGRRTTA